MSAARLATPVAIAIDGGGTKTTACLAALDDSGEPVLLAEATSGASNPAALDLETAKRNIAAAIRAVQLEADCQHAPIERMIAGLSGIEATGLHEELATWARENFDAHEATFFTDVELLHFAGKRVLPAIVLISGTGSVAYGKNQAGKIGRTGGRGYLMGDEGSGFWIGQRGLIAATQALDHAADDTAIVDLLAQDLGCRDADGWTKQIYALQDPRGRIAQMSRRVVDAALEGDAVACGILNDAAKALAHLVDSVAGQLDLRSTEFDLIKAGGIVTNVEAIQDALVKELAHRKLKISEQREIQSPAREAAIQSLAQS